MFTRLCILVSCPFGHDGHYVEKKSLGSNVVFCSYVHGIMDGEVIQAEIDKGRGLKQEDFEVFKII